MMNDAKSSLMPATVWVMKKSKIFYALLYFFLSTVSLSFFGCLSVVYCLPVCLPVYAGVSYYELSIFDIPNGLSSKFFKKFSTFLTIWTPSIPFTLVSGSFCLHFSGSTLIFCFRANHLPSKRRVATVVPNFDEELKVFKCISPLCKVT